MIKYCYYSIYLTGLKKPLTPRVLELQKIILKCTRIIITLLIIIITNYFFRLDFKGLNMWFVIVLTFLMCVVARSEEIAEYRLPTNFKPISYRLDITTHLDDRFIFEGVVNIKVSATDRLTKYKIN